MTRLAMFTDVHADVHSVRDALAQIERAGCAVVVCAGDLIDYGLFPEETLELLEHAKVPCIRGNHDRWAIASERDGARDASGWDLSRRATGFLERLPTSWSATIDGVRVAVHHASPRSDMDGIDPEVATVDDARAWLAGAKADVLLVGHTHRAFAMEVFGGGLIANPGALLRDPANPDEHRARIEAAGPAASAGGGTFGMLELPAKRFTVHRAVDGGEVEIPRSIVGVRERA